MADADQVSFLEAHFGMREPAVDPDGTFNGRLAPQTQAKLLNIYSLLMLVTGLIGILHGWVWHGLAVCVGGIFSLIHWSDPMPSSPQRLTDVTWANLLLCIHLVAAANTAIFIPYLLMMFIASGFYYLSWDAIKRTGASWPSTIAHLAMHTCGHISAITLYVYG